MFKRSNYNDYLVISGFNDHSFRIYNGTKEIKREQCESKIKCFAVHEKESIILCGHPNGAISMWFYSLKNKLIKRNKEV